MDQTVEALGANRSAFIREAVQAALRRYRIQQMEEQHAAAYAAQPMTADELEGWDSIRDWGEA
jgi:metal-responsive CopG/Arc/MetJ family transcriptional regulator